MLRSRAPLVAAELRELEEARREHLSQYSSGSRLTGAENLLEYLERAHDAYLADTDLAPIAFLLKRARADVVTALDATLGGLIAVAADCMRDVLEIETLLYDFAIDKECGNRWLRAGQSERRRHWAQFEVRKRLREAGLAELTSSAEEVDYAAHSRALHVNPVEPAIGRRGHTDDHWAVDAGFWELFEHGARLIAAIEFLRAVRWKGGPVVPELLSLDRLDDARSRTQQMQDVYLALLEAPKQLSEELGREPTEDEIGRHVSQRLNPKGRNA